MKKIELLQIILLSLFLLLAICTAFIKKPEPVQETPEPVPVIPQPIETFFNGTAIPKDSPLCLMGRDNKMHPILKLNECTVLQAVYYDDQISLYQNTDEFADDAQTYFHVIYDSVDYWIGADFFAPESKPAVIIRNATLYSDSDLKNSLGKKLPFGTTIAIQVPVALETGTTYTCSKIYYYDAGTKKMQSAYVYNANLSHRVDDIEVVKIVNELQITSRAGPRNQLFWRAKNFNPCPAVKAALEAQKTEVVTNSYQEALKALPRGRYGVNVPELLTVDQSQDPFQ